MPRIRNAFLAFACALPLFAAAHPARAAMEDYPVIKLQSLDKVTARTMTFEARVGSTVKFGNLFIKVQSCRKAPPIEQPESAAFLQIWEVTPRDESEWIFSGWMFASSPALSPMDHPIYDVWVLDCLTHKTGEAPPPEAKKADEQPADSQSAAVPAPAAETVSDADIPVEDPPPSTDAPSGATRDAPAESVDPAAAPADVVPQDQ